jgi:hypothetical protein
MRPIYWDIVVLLIPWLAIEEVKSVFAEALLMTKNETAVMQKKGKKYQLLVGHTQTRKRYI